MTTLDDLRSTEHGGKIVHTMMYLKAEAVRWADNEFPGWVEITFGQADGSTARLVEKAPVVDGEDRLTPVAVYPVALELGCGISHVDRDRRVATVEPEGPFIGRPDIGTSRAECPQLGKRVLYFTRASFRVGSVVRTAA